MLWCWFKSFSASASEAGVSSDATSVWVLVSHAWKWSRSRRNRWRSPASSNFESRSFSICLSCSHICWICVILSRITAASSGCSVPIESASCSRESSFACMAARSRSMPESRRCRVMMPVRSISRLSVDCKILFLSSIQDNVSRHSMWNVCTPWAEFSSSRLASAFSRSSAHSWFNWFCRATICSELGCSTCSSCRASWFTTATRDALAFISFSNPS